MRKGLFASTLLATVGMLFGAVVGCTPKAVVYTCSINNKTELEAEWLSDAPGRAMALTITKNGEEQNALEAISDGDLTFTTSDEAVAIVVGKNITPVGEGSATITASYFGAVDSVTVTITKADTHGKSIDDPLTVAEAIAICKETGTTSTTIEYFVAGQVSAVTAEYDDAYGNISFKIVDAVGDTESVTCYRVKPGEGIDPTIIGPKSQVIVSGTLVNYNGNTPEINAGGTIHRATAGEKGQVIEATVAEALQAAILLPDNESSLDTYVVTGYVIAFSGTDFYLADEKGARDATQDDFLVYGWKTPAGEEEITLNAKVKVTATLKHYVSTSTAGKYAYETNKPTSVEILESGDEAIVHEVTYAEAETVFAGLADNETTTDKYAVTGYVISKGTWSDSFNNGDFVIGASIEATAGIKVFRWAGAKADFEALEVGERVKVTGKLQKYVKDGVTTPEIIGSTEVESLGIDLTAITLSETSKTVAVGADPFTLTATPVPAKASLEGLVWASSNTGVATVSTSGLVTIVGAGTTNITATVGTIVATCAVTVAEGETHATAVELNHETLTLVLGGEGATLTYTTTPAEVTDTVAWSSDHEDIATVADGVVTAVAVGTANITVTVGSVSATCAVTVNAKHGTTEADPLSAQEAYDLASTDKTTEFYIEGVVIAEDDINATYKNVTVTLDTGDADKVFKIFQLPLGDDFDTLKGNFALGTKVLVKSVLTKYNTTAETPKGKGEFVSADVSEFRLVKLSGASSVAVDANITLTATAYPVAHGTGTFTWESADTSIATVADGVVTGVAAGTTTITATETNGLSATLEVTVTSGVVKTPYVLDGTQAGKGNAYANFGTATQNEITWKIQGNLEMNPWRIGGKSITNTNRSMYNQNALSGDYDKIEIEFGTASGITVNSINVGVYSTAEKAAAGGEGDVGNYTPTFVASSTVTVTKTPGENWAGCFYNITLNVTVGGSSNKFVQLISVTFAYNA